MWDKIHWDIAKSRGATDEEAREYVSTQLEMMADRRRNWPKGLREIAERPMRGGNVIDAESTDVPNHPNPAGLFDK